MELRSFFEPCELTFFLIIEVGSSFGAIYSLQISGSKNLSER